VDSAEHLLVQLFLEQLGVAQNGVREGVLGVEVGDDNSSARLLLDTTGFRQYTALQIKNHALARRSQFRIERVTSAAWAADNPRSSTRSKTKPPSALTPLSSHSWRDRARLRCSTRIRRAFPPRHRTYPQRRFLCSRSPATQRVKSAFFPQLSRTRRLAHRSRAKTTNEYYVEHHPAQYGVRRTCAAFTAATKRRRFPRSLLHSHQLRRSHLSPYQRRREQSTRRKPGANSFPIARKSCSPPRKPSHRI